LPSIGVEGNLLAGQQENLLEVGKQTGE